MKKIYILLLLTINAASTLCMYKERYKQDACYDTDSSISLDHIPVYTHHTSLQNQQQPAYTEANEPGWEQYNAIMNMTYKKDEPVTLYSVDLTPVYTHQTSCHTPAPLNKSTRKKKDRKTLLHKLNPTQPNSDLMEALYKTAYDCFISPAPMRALSVLIKNMKIAKENGITEDMMGRFSNDAWNYDPSTALLFSCLKRYALTPDTEKKSPSSYTLAENLNIVTSIIPQEYSSYLCKAVKKLKKEKHSFAIEAIADYLYRNETTSCINYMEGHYTHLTKEVYQLAYYPFTSGMYTNELYKLLQIIDKAKIAGDIHQETDLGYAILAFEPSLLDKISSYLQHLIQYSTTDIKNRITLFCTFIQEYNQARGTKKTPSYRHNSCYNLKKSLDLALPDNFNNSLFDENHYAFTEFKQLITKAGSIVDADNQEVQECVDQLYPSRNVI